MNIALIGASGFIGAALLNEALARGHQVTALVTRPQRLGAAANLTALQSDIRDTATLVQQLAGHDAVISAFSGHGQTDVQRYYEQGIDSLIRAVKQARLSRLLLVGGAGSLEVAPGVALLDTPAFPAEYRATAEGARTALTRLRAEPALNWTMLSPAAVIAPGERTGHFRLGGDQLLLDAAGDSRISVADYAVAMLDELERPVHPRQRFTVAY